MLEQLNIVSIFIKHFLLINHRTQESGITSVLLIIESLHTLIYGRIIDSHVCNILICACFIVIFFTAALIKATAIFSDHAFTVLFAVHSWGRVRQQTISTSLVMRDTTNDSMHICDVFQDTFIAIWAMRNMVQFLIV